MPAPTITPLPTAPSRVDEPALFVSRADTFVAALPDFGAEMNALAAYLEGVTGSAGPIGSTALTMNTARILGRTTADTGAIEEITVGAGLSLAGGVLSGAAQSYILSFFFTSTPTAGETLLIHVAGRAFTIPADFAGALRSTVGVNPTASFALDVQKNGATIGTITVSTGGVVTATTTGGLAQSIAAGDVLTVLAPTPADATAANMACSIVGGA